jgi:hypothetical protein
LNVQIFDMRYSELSEIQSLLPSFCRENC